ncbi:MAG: ABC-2 transporter permease [Eubacteriales bacterium]|nr:ABC-2 transporter permease [Eubacteriales bacterium]
MKAMLYADWITLRRSLRVMLFVLVASAVSAVLWNGPLFFCFSLMFFAVMLPGTLLTADHAQGWDRLSLALPIRRRDVVGSKFLLSVLVNAALLVLTVALCAVYAVTQRTTDLTELVGSALACEAVALVMMGVLLALEFKFGVEKGRYIIIGCAWLPPIAAYLMREQPWFRAALDGAQRWLDSAAQEQLVLLLAAALAVGVVVYALCCAVSVWIYRKTDL